MPSFRARPLQLDSSCCGLPKMVKKALLVLYNASMAVVWGLVLFRTASSLVAHQGDVSHVWKDAGHAASEPSCTDWWWALQEEDGAT